MPDIASWLPIKGKDGVLFPKGGLVWLSSPAVKGGDCFDFGQWSVGQPSAMQMLGARYGPNDKEKSQFWQTACSHISLQNRALFLFSFGGNLYGSLFSCIFFYYS